MQYLMMSDRDLTNGLIHAELQSANQNNLKEYLQLEYHRRKDILGPNLFVN
jgi:hypothetical protein